MAKQKAPPKGVLTSKDFFAKLKTDAGSVNLALLYGEETYFFESAVNVLRSKFISPGSEQMDVCYLDGRSGPKISIDSIEEMLASPPWISEKKLVIVRDSGLFSGEVTEKFTDLISNVPDSAILIFLEEKMDCRKKPFKEFLSKGTVCLCSPMTEEQLAGWVAKRLGKAGISITSEAAASMAVRCSMSLNMLANEINKMSLYCKGAGITSVDLDIVESCCPPDLSGKVFSIMDACGTGRAEAALDTLNTLIITKQPVIVIRVTFMNHLKRLICAKDIGDSRELASRLGIMDFVAEKLVRQARRFDMERLLGLYLEAVRQDSDIKHGLIDERTSLETIIVKASSRS